jgi:hypothetical protein
LLSCYILLPCCEYNSVAIVGMMACFTLMMAVRKGNKMGTKLVVHPKLCPEPRSF